MSTDEQSLELPFEFQHRRMENLPRDLMEDWAERVATARVAGADDRDRRMAEKNARFVERYGGGDEPIVTESKTPQEMADELGVPLENLAHALIEQTAHYERLGQVIAEQLSQAISEPPTPNRQARRLAAGKGPKRARHGMMKDAQVQAQLKKPR